MRILVTDTTWNMAIFAKKLRDAGFFVTDAGDVDELLEFARNGQHDAVLIDPDLPSGRVSDVLRQLRAINPQMPVCIHAPRLEEEDRLRAIASGADDVFDGEMTALEIQMRLRAHVRRSAGFSTATIEVGELLVNTETHQVCLRDMPVHLTRLEYELVEALCLRNGKLITREQIMLQLYAWQNEPDSKIIDVYICRIRAKLVAAGASDDVIMTSFSQGYRLNNYVTIALPDAA